MFTSVDRRSRSREIEREGKRGRTKEREFVKHRRDAKDCTRIFTTKVTGNMKGLRTSTRETQRPKCSTPCTRGAAIYSDRDDAITYVVGYVHSVQVGQGSTWWSPTNHAGLPFMLPEWAMKTKNTSSDDHYRGVLNIHFKDDGDTYDHRQHNCTHTTPITFTLTASTACVDICPLISYAVIVPTRGEENVAVTTSGGNVRQMTTKGAATYCRPLPMDLTVPAARVALTLYLLDRGLWLATGTTKSNGSPSSTPKRRACEPAFHLDDLHDALMRVDAELWFLSSPKYQKQIRRLIAHGRKRYQSAYFSKNNAATDRSTPGVAPPPPRNDVSPMVSDFLKKNLTTDTVDWTHVPAHFPTASLRRRNRDDHKDHDVQSVDSTYLDGRKRDSTYNRPRSNDVALQILHKLFTYRTIQASPRAEPVSATVAVATGTPATGVLDTMAKPPPPQTLSRRQAEALRRWSSILLQDTSLAYLWTVLLGGAQVYNFYDRRLFASFSPECRLCLTRMFHWETPLALPVLFTMADHRRHLLEPAYTATPPSVRPHVSNPDDEIDVATTVTVDIQMLLAWLKRVGVPDVCSPADLRRLLTRVPTVNFSAFSKWAYGTPLATRANPSSNATDASTSVVKRGRGAETAVDVPTVRNDVAEWVGQWPACWWHCCVTRGVLQAHREQSGTTATWISSVRPSEVKILARQTTTPACVRTPAAHVISSETRAVCVSKASELIRGSRSTFHRARPATEAVISDWEGMVRTSRRISAYVHGTIDTAGISVPGSRHSAPQSRGFRRLLSDLGSDATPRWQESSLAESERLGILKFILIPDPHARGSGTTTTGGELYLVTDVDWLAAKRLHDAQESFIRTVGGLSTPSSTYTLNNDVVVTSSETSKDTQVTPPAPLVPPVVLTTVEMSQEDFTDESVRICWGSGPASTETEAHHLGRREHMENQNVHDLRIRGVRRRAYSGNQWRDICEKNLAHIRRWVRPCEEQLAPLRAIHAGTPVITILGSAGSGKSTIVSLLHKTGPLWVPESTIFGPGAEATTPPSNSKVTGGKRSRLQMQQASAGPQSSKSTTGNLKGQLGKRIGSKRLNLVPTRSGGVLYLAPTNQLVSDQGARYGVLAWTLAFLATVVEKCVRAHIQLLQDVRCIVVDEISMVSETDHLCTVFNLRKLGLCPQLQCIIILGDEAQLPPVGPGSLLPFARSLICDTGRVVVGTGKAGVGKKIFRLSRDHRSYPGTSTSTLRNFQTVVRAATLASQRDVTTTVDATTFTLTLDGSISSTMEGFQGTLRPPPASTSSSTSNSPPHPQEVPFTLKTYERHVLGVLHAVPSWSDVVRLPTAVAATAPILYSEPTSVGAMAAVIRNIMRGNRCLLETQVITYRNVIVGAINRELCRQLKMPLPDQYGRVTELRKGMKLRVKEPVGPFERNTVVVVETIYRNGSDGDSRHCLKNGRRSPVEPEMKRRKTTTCPSAYANASTVVPATRRLQKYDRRDGTATAAWVVRLQSSAYPDGVDLAPISQRDLQRHFDVGYVTTVHSMQGMQCNDVVFVLDHCSRELLYTACTRPRRRLVLLGHRDSIMSYWLRGSGARVDKNSVRLRPRTDVKRPTSSRSGLYIHLLHDVLTGTKTAVSKHRHLSAVDVFDLSRKWYIDDDV